MIEKTLFLNIIYDYLLIDLLESKNESMMLKLIKEFPINFEYNSDYLTITAYSYVFFLIVFRFLAPYVSSKLTKSYDKLTCNQKIEWNSRFETISNLFYCNMHVNNKLNLLF